MDTKQAGSGPGWFVEVWVSKKVLRNEKFRVRLVREGNHERLAQGEGYVRHADALATAHLIADPSGAEVHDLR